MAEFWQALGNLISDFFNWVSYPIYYIYCWFHYSFGLGQFFRFMNDWVCNIIDLVLYAFPSTPSNLKLGYLLTSMSLNNPLGYSIAVPFLESLVAILGIVVIVKAFKMIPFI